MNASDDPSPNSKLITDLDEEYLRALDIDRSYYGEIGNWSVHRYGEKSFVLLTNQNKFPAIEVNDVESVIRTLKGERLSKGQFKNLIANLHFPVE